MFWPNTACSTQRSVMLYNQRKSQHLMHSLLSLHTIYLLKETMKLPSAVLTSSQYPSSLNSRATAGLRGSIHTKESTNSSPFTSLLNPKPDHRWVEAQTDIVVNWPSVDSPTSQKILHPVSVKKKKRLCGVFSGSLHN